LTAVKRGPIANTCLWHRSGVPVRFSGDAFRWRWYVANCPVCAAKWAGREVPEDVYTPLELVRRKHAWVPKGKFTARWQAELAGRRRAKGMAA
jgi:hypothetical protein